MGRQVNTLGLGKPYIGIILTGFREIIKFSLNIIKKVGFYLER